MKVNAARSRLDTPVIDDRLLAGAAENRDVRRGNEAEILQPRRGDRSSYCVKVDLI
jgi:hypothetical protein